MTGQDQGTWDKTWDRTLDKTWDRRQDRTRANHANYVKQAMVHDYDSLIKYYARLLQYKWHS